MHIRWFDSRLFAAADWTWRSAARARAPSGTDDAAGLRDANAQLRELLEERNARIAGQAAEIPARGYRAEDRDAGAQPRSWRVTW